MAPYTPRWHVVLLQPEIPQNTGNIGRTCAAAGAKLWLVRPLGFRLDHSHLRRAGLDYWDHLDWEVVDDWLALCDGLQQRHGVERQQFWYFTKSAAREYHAAPLRPHDVFVFGSETQGLPAELLAAAGERALRIPMRAPVRSLNLASSAAVVVYEAWRQAQT